MQKLANDFGVEMHCISGGRPWANGQAESAVKLVKQKIKMFCLERDDGHDGN